MSAYDVSELLNNCEVSLSHIRRAVHHLTKHDRAVLYDEDHHDHKSAEGRFFEALVYEILLDVGESSSKIESIAAKYSDAQYTAYDKYSKDGLWYSKDGGIRFKISGNTAAEIDFLIKTSDGVRIFGEAATSVNGAKGFSSEMESKRDMLLKLYGGKVEFIIILSGDVSYRPKCLEADDSYAIIPCGNKMYQKIAASEVLKRNLSSTRSSKRVDGKLW